MKKLRKKAGNRRTRKKQEKSDKKNAKLARRATRKSTSRMALKQKERTERRRLKSEAKALKAQAKADSGEPSIMEQVTGVVGGLFGGKNQDSIEQVVSSPNLDFSQFDRVTGGFSKTPNSSDETSEDEFAQKSVKSEASDMIGEMNKTVTTLLDDFLIMLGLKSDPNKA